jgi:exodeoxyribonuclease VII large subunit
MSVDTYSVARLTAYIRDLFEADGELQDVWVAGEVSNMTQASSGHWYFTLKDESAQLRGVMWRSSVARQNYTPRDGDAVVAHGRVGVYEPRGEYQLYADRIRPEGVGDLYRQFEELKARLDTEGLFDESLKQPIPLFPRRIGVVTSPTAAAFQDIQNVLQRRYPLTEVILSPTLVQGKEAPSQIVAAIERLNTHTDVDVILVIRGGGSIEDLWAFNDEQVARAILASQIPIISGVGHEIDFTIADFVADTRAPTPSAAAEVATPDSDELRAETTRRAAALDTLIAERVGSERHRLTMTQRTLAHVSPQAYISTMRQRIDGLSTRLENRQQVALRLFRERLMARFAALDAANPQAILARGYAIVTRSEDGYHVTSEQDAVPGTGITIRLHEGQLRARVEDNDSHERYRRTLF